MKSGLDMLYIKKKNTINRINIEMLENIIVKIT